MNPDPKDLNELSSHARSGLTDALFKLVSVNEISEKHETGAPSGAHTPTYESLAPYETLKNLNAELLRNANLSAQYLLRQSTTHFRSMNKRFSDINTKVSKATKTLQRATYEISRYTSGKTKNDTRAQKSVIEMMDSTEELTYWLVDEIPKFNNDFSTGLEALQRAAIIMKTSPDFSNEELEDLDAAKELTASQLETFCNVIMNTSGCLPEIEMLGSGCIDFARTA